MSWASRRRFLILFLLGSVAAAFFITLSIATFYKTPSCSDHTQNQGEVGIDCGGPCPYLCQDQERVPTVLFTKTIPNGTGRTDIVASIENVNSNAAAKNVPYTLALYGTNEVLLQQLTGTIDLPPGGTVPLFIPGVASGNQIIANAFLTIDPTMIQWFTMRSDTIKPQVTNITLTGAAAAPRITAVLTNTSISALTNIEAVALVHNAQKDVIAASKTIIPTIPPQGQATATFTWNAQFSDVPTTIEVIPIMPLP